MKVLELINVNKDYKLANKENFRALHDVNVAFEKGELVSIIGESGSGKSTLMNLIGGLDSSYDGIINIDGKDLKSFKDKQLDDYRKKKIGFVFQSFNLIPHLSVLDNVTIGLTLSNEKESVKLQKATTLLTKLGLKDQIKKKPTQLSGGQKQRVAIARALINDPDIILADEPTGALDSGTTSQILSILKEIADDGKLVIMVTHSEKVASISSRIVEIADGRIVRDSKKKNYKKTQVHDKLVEEQTDIPQKKKEGHLSFFSAFRLSLHNMWAGKVKNLLMAFGVSIALVSMILMLSFGSGLTSYISSMADEYSRPDIVTISNTKGTFSDEDISSLVEELNTHLKTQGNSFKIINSNDENKNLSYGIMLPPMQALVNLTYTKTDGTTASEPAMVTYTVPPYYDEKDFASKETGYLCGEDEIMVSSTILKKLEVDNADDAVGKEITLNLTYTNGSTQISITKTVKISAIIDNSMMTILYVDYDYLNKCIKDYQEANNLEITGMQPSSLYISTDGENTTNLINSYIKENKPELAGSVEEQLAGMFGELMNTFSIALTVISGIALFVALIMILVVLYMSVAERTKEIGVLKSIGARKKDIRLIFSSESFLVGLLSGIVSIILALIFGGIFTIVFNSLLGFAPISMEIQYFAIALLISVIISVLAGLYPSSKAAKLDPVESLRRE
ncbi:MAG: ATP-binding cassette domain-containing protein [Clostridiales bacterium]|nr:ATP-binding cassette domain-containing protein [Clostridiales bacterium]